MIDVVATIICGLTAYITGKYLLTHYNFFKSRRMLAWALACYPMQFFRYLGAKYFNINQVIFGTNPAGDIIECHNYMLLIITFFVVLFLIYYQIKIAIPERQK
ncbi:MAG: hypothetical protein IKS15_06010 [Opitutales bacterium]|nr:hypothetical protein [Opitutales bacterium]